MRFIAEFSACYASIYILMVHFSDSQHSAPCIPPVILPKKENNTTNLLSFQEAYSYFLMYLTRKSTTLIVREINLKTFTDRKISKYTTAVAR
jgi:hypothetical protein